MNLDMNYEVPLGKYNKKWCERRPLVCSNNVIYSKARKHLVQKQLTPAEKAVMFVHDLVDCQGLEFVAFSNAHFKKPVKLPEQAILIPCFLPEIERKNWKEPLVQLTFRMMQLSRFIYDGWIPVSDWSIESVREVIRKVNRMLTIFSIQERTWFAWEPKYIPSEVYPSYCQIEDLHLQEIKNLNSFVESWTDDDSRAFYRSVAWLSQSLILPEPAARFLFYICAIESLVRYIEKESKSNSIFSGLKASRMRSKEQRKKCINDTLNSLYASNPIGAIESAFFGCIELSIRKMLEVHLERVFSNDPEAIDLLFREKIEGKTLYDLRNLIAHGGMDALDDLQRQRVSERIWDIERIARQYLVNVLRLIWNKSPFEQKVIKSMHVPFQVVSREDMYIGPIHMAEIYATRIV